MAHAILECPDNRTDGCRACNGQGYHTCLNCKGVGRVAAHPEHAPAEHAKPGAKQFPCDVCGKMIWGGWFALGIAGQPPSPVKCGACSNPQKQEILPPRVAISGYPNGTVFRVIDGVLHQVVDEAPPALRPKPEIDSYARGHAEGWNAAIEQCIEIVNEEQEREKKLKDTLDKLRKVKS